jgi:hypothetical protein
MADRTQPLAVACENFEQDLVLLHYGDLTGAERDTVQGHVKTCAACAAYLGQLDKLLPLTIKADEPEPSFWDDYSRELRRKLDAASGKPPWWRSLAVLFQPRLLPAFAAAVVVAIALAFTFGRGVRPLPEIPQVDRAMIEALPVAENLEFFRNMDVLDNLDLLESMSAPGNA